MVWSSANIQSEFCLKAVIPCRPSERMQAWGTFFIPKSPTSTASHCQHEKFHICNFQLEFFTCHMEPHSRPSMECSFTVEQPLRRADSLSLHITLQSLFQCACMWVCECVCVCVYVCVCVCPCALTAGLTEQTSPCEPVWQRFSTCILTSLYIFVPTSLFPHPVRHNAFQNKLHSSQTLISGDVWRFQPIDRESMTRQCVVKWSA